LKLHRPLALIGLRCSGKSTVGALLARQCEAGFVDLDEALRYSFQSDCCSAHGTSLEEWIEAHGWEAFRDAEQAEFARALGAGEARVIATGGGVVEREANRRLLAQRATVVWLRESTEELVRRAAAAGAGRPALVPGGWATEFREVGARRAPLYAECAHIAIDCAGRAPEELAREVLLRLAQDAQSPQARP
jgi:shikimate kinase